jgi:hypothetical protein
MIDQEVAARVQKYKGNVPGLQKEYAASQQLIDLLALQKIKSMQESAAREMQLQMAQQQAANGESSSTIAQQREKQVMDMTKNELAQQRGELAQQQGVEQKQAMQKLMGGIASAPGAASVMEPQAMAAGGIVAFKEGDGVKDERYKRKEGESLSDFNNRVLQLELEDRKAESAKRNAERESERQRMLAERGGAAIPPSRLFDRAPLPASVSPPAAPQQQGLGGLPNAQQAPRLPVSEAQATMQAGPQAAMPAPAPRPMAPSPQVAQKPPMPAAPPKPQEQGLGGLQMGPPEDTLQNALRRQSIAGMNIDPKAEKLAEEKRVEDRLKLTPAQRGVFDEGIAGLKGMFDQDFDPELQRREGVKRYLLGMGGRSMGEFAGGAGNAMDFDTRQKAQKLARFKDLQEKREGLVGLERDPVVKGIDAGFKAYEQTGNTQRNALTAGANVFGTETQSKDNAAQREAKATQDAAQNAIEKLKIGAQNAATAAQRDANDFAKLSGHLSTITNNRARAEQAVVNAFKKDAQAIEMALMANPKDKEALGRKAALQLEIDAAVDKTTKPFDLLASSIQAKLYGGGGQGGLGGFTVREKPAK